MGSSVDSHRIDKVFRNHRSELLRGLRRDQSSELVWKFTLRPGIDAIGVTLHLVDGSAIDVPKYWDVDALIERFPDCA
jgi:hypothetical protein